MELQQCHASIDERSVKSEVLLQKIPNGVARKAGTLMGSGAANENTVRKIVLRQPHPAEA